MINQTRKRKYSQNPYHPQRICIVLSLFLLLSIYASAQIIVEADTVAKLGQTFNLRYQYTTNDSTERIVSQTWDWDKNNNGFKVITGPVHSSLISTTIKNGETTTLYGKTFSFMLSFNKEGRYSMPIMKAQTSSGKVLFSSPFSISAIKETESLSSDTTTSIPSKNDFLVVEASVSNNHITLGDSIVCELQLYTKLDIIQITPSSTLAIYPAYWHEYKLPEEKLFEMTEYEGEYVRSIPLRKFSVIPMQAGEIVLEPMKFTATVLGYNSGFDPLEAFFNGDVERIERDTVIYTNPIKIHVEDSKISPTGIAIDSNSTHSLGIVIDRSSSLMTQSDSLSPTYLQLENKFLERLKDIKDITDYSVTIFAGKPHFPNSFELSNLINILPSKDNDGSAIYDAILASALHDGALTTERPLYSILLLTDGSDNKSRLSDKTLINLLHRHNIRVDVITFASRNDSVYYFMNDTIGGQMIRNWQDLSDVERIAKETGGLFIQISDEKQIDNAIRKVKDVQSRQAPDRLPGHDFLPDPYLLNLLYKEIEQDAMKEF